MAYKGKRINPQKFERGQIKIIAILLPLVIFMALPIVFIANHAFKPMDELFAFPPTFFVRNATLENFTKLIKFSRTAGVPLSRYVFNSLLVTGLTVGLSLLFTTFAAFALAKLKFKGRQLMMDINQLALMFVATAVLIPRYLVICKVGLIDSDLLGCAFEPEQRFENPDGTSILFDTDYLGEHRGVASIPGPFASAEAAAKLLWED